MESKKLSKAEYNKMRKEVIAWLKEDLEKKLAKKRKDREKFEQREREKGNPLFM